ncbi:hypothetical protein [Halorussus caseinilyticus]|uniref:Sulfatase N-terminal domain-containing protein n=1 Tax=Halorussus caseinilyticus TaxID=3034025 RepID=A0ABD5WPC0_9EURY
MYSLEQLRQGVENPRAALRELNRLYWTRLGGRDYNTGGTALFEEDWDNCLILDGCRYDTFADVGREFDLDGTLDSRESRGSATAEFHEVVDVWGDAIDYGDDGVPPEPLAEAARDAAVEYPDKRLLVHFVQPHAPYLGERGRAAFPDYRSNPLADKFLGRIDAPERLLRTVYRENLELVLSEVEGLLPDLPERRPSPPTTGCCWANASSRPDSGLRPPRASLHRRDGRSPVVRSPQRSQKEPRRRTLGGRVRREADRGGGRTGPRASGADGVPVVLRVSVRAAYQRPFRRDASTPRQ